MTIYGVRATPEVFMPKPPKDSESTGGLGILGFVLVR